MNTTRLGAKCRSLLIVVVSVCSILLIHRHFVVDGGASSLVRQLNDVPAVRVDPVSPFRPLSEQLEQVITATRPVLSPSIQEFSLAGDYSRARDTLLERALQAVASGDNDSLALQLSELGELALLQADLSMAEVYLTEALEMYDELNDELKVAGVHVQLGRLHLYARQRARKASDAYDQLLISRWHISEGLFYEVEDQIKQVIETNLGLNRFGAAASAYETLHRGYNSDNNILQAQNAGIEAIRLHAASGNLYGANRLLHKMKRGGMSDYEAEKVERELDLHFREYENSVLAIGAARDYSQLYNQLASRGDALQAWRFRQQAEQSLDQASSRARYRRQPDVLVNLYLSNDSMKRALSSLQKADAVYSRYGLDDGVDRSRQLQKQIY